jgi:small subunit ribosomal protein S6e
MVYKINIADKGKTIKFETDNEELIDKIIGETISGKEINADLEGYELKITGTSDKAGFPGLKNIPGGALKHPLLVYGIGMHKKPKGLSKKPVQSPHGLRLRKTVRGNAISADTVQINTIVVKEGNKKFIDMLPKKEDKAAQ